MHLRATTDWRASVEESLLFLCANLQARDGLLPNLLPCHGQSQPINVAATYEATVLGGFLANKGGLGLSLWIRDRSI